MHLTLLQFIILSFASFRLTHLLVFDKITSFIRAPFFEEFMEKDENGKEELYIMPKQSGVRGWIGELLSCYWCTGIWMAIFLFLFAKYVPYIADPVILILAVAGVGAFIESIIQKLVNE
ncbi:DUF1360 domain-containing protein [Falsibacillus albus]|uniref:DUF1360 domain-containing protein n=1 Tax=Falsibacillus albus TaxID=2478915 RepID=A0A3L7K3F1_9BACI|nr:DUF1360 domain-containing protein [Falsibacillus albus]RLQ97165.1 DUF1360 domain-containing protein [Falsibacillus albus]